MQRLRGAQDSTNAVSFEVASIRRNVAEEGPVVVAFQPGGRFVMTNAPITALLGNAYQAATHKVVGAPDWLGTESYDIQAKAPTDSTRAEMVQMLRTLLAERLKLSFHIEQRNEDAFNLVRIAPAGRLGPALKRVDVDCERRAAEALKGQPPPPLPVSANGLAACRFVSYDGVVLSGGMTMAQFATAVSQPAARPVVDMTGLPGRYEVTLRYRPGPVTGNDGPGDLPDVFTAIREQLGLNLRSSRTVTDTFVIDHVERPTVQLAGRHVWADRE